MYLYAHLGRSCHAVVKTLRHYKIHPPRTLKCSNVVSSYNILNRPTCTVGHSYKRILCYAEALPLKELGLINGLDYC